MKPFAALLTSVLLLFLTGCAGYHIGAQVPKKMKDVKTVAVPTFHNNTLVPRMESLAASTVVKQFQQDGTFQVRNADEADVIIEGTITSLKRRGARSVRSDVERQQEYYLDITFAFNVIKRDTGARLDYGTLTGEATFFVSGNDVNQDERQAIPLAIEKAAVRLVNRVTTGW
jgi:hypothetical protein